MWNVAIVLAPALKLELVEAKWALEATQKAVRNIDQRQLKQVMTQKKPPKPVEMAMMACLVDG